MTHTPECHQSAGTCTGNPEISCHQRNVCLLEIISRTCFVIYGWDSVNQTGKVKAIPGLQCPASSPPVHQVPTQTARACCPLPESPSSFPTTTGTVNCPGTRVTSLLLKADLITSLACLVYVLSNCQNLMSILFTRHLDVKQSLVPDSLTYQICRN